MEGKFKFFVPFTLQKGKDEEGNEEMKIKGVASTKSRDADGESLDPAGFDLSYFKANGTLNWNHSWKENPLAIVGQPTKAEIRNGDFYLEGSLYKDNPLAKNIYKLAEILEKNSDDRRLGFSIEGQALERDVKDPTKVKRALITSVAITPQPKNQDSVLELSKSYQYDVLTKGGDDFILYTKDAQTGEEWGVDKNFNILHKALQSGSSTGRETTNSGVASGAPLKEEDVEGEEYNVDDEDWETLKTKKRKKLSKSFLYQHIYKYFYQGNDIQKAKDIYTLITNIPKSMKRTEVEVQDLLKAYEVLNIEAPANLLEKGKKEEKREDEEDEDTYEMAKAIVKAMDEDDASEDDMEEALKGEGCSGDMISKVMKEHKSLKKAQRDDMKKSFIKKEEEGDEDEEEDEDVKKAKAKAFVKKAKAKGKKKKEIIAGLMEKGYSKDIVEKSVEDMDDEDDQDDDENESNQDIEEKGKKTDKSVKKVKDEMTKGFNELKELLVGKQEVDTAQKTLLKSLSDQVSQLSSKIQGLEDKNKELETVLSSTPAGPKSMLSKSFHDRFEKAPEGITVLNVNDRLEKSRVLQVLDAKIGDWNGPATPATKVWRDAACQLESSNTLPQNILAQLEREDKIRVVQ